MQLLKNTNINFTSKTIQASIVSIVCIVIGICSLLYKGGPSLSIDFTGGTIAQIKLETIIDISEIRHSLSGYGLPGAEIIEFHVVFDKRMFGPDSSSSLTIDEIRTLVEGIIYIEKAHNFSIKNDFDTDMKKIKKIFEKSLAVNKTLKIGHKISFDDLESKKPPSMGISTAQFEDILGKKLNKNKNKYDFLNYEDLK